MSYFQKHRTWIAAAVTFSSAVSQLKAADASDYLLFSKGPVLLRPRLGVSEDYIDNLFSQHIGQGDLITSISPGLNLQYGRLANNFMVLDYGFNQRFYTDRTDLNAGEHSFSLRNRIQGERLVFSGSDTVQFLSSPIGFVTEYRPAGATVQPVPSPDTGATTPPVTGGEIPSPVRGSELIASIADRNVGQNVYSDSYQLGYAISQKTAVYLQGSHSTTDYETGISLYDINTLRGTAGFAFQAFPKVGFFGETFYGQTATGPNFPAPKFPHVEFIGGSIGVRGNFTEKLSGTVRVGYEVFEFSDRTPAPSAPVVDASLSHRLSDKTSLSLSYSRQHDVSIQYGKQIYTADAVNFQWDQIIGPSHKWRTTLGGRFGATAYETEGAAAQIHYDQYSAYFRLAYQFQMWLTANLGYTWDSIRTGTGGGSDYDVNRISMGVSIGY